MNQRRNYNKIDSCEFTRGIDNLLKNYELDNKILIDLIKTNPDGLIDLWTKRILFKIDNKCECQLGQLKERSKFSCAECTNLSRIVDFRDNCINKPFEIECGTRTGQKLVIVDRILSKLYLNKDPAATDKSKLYSLQYPELLTCGTDIANRTSTIRGDSFTIGTLVSLMIYDIFKNKKLPHISQVHTSFVCSDKGFALIESPSIGMITSAEILNHVDVKSIIQQLLVSLIELSKLNFSHGAPNIRNLFLDKKPFSYRYDNINIKGNITLKLGNFWNSSATFSSTHYFSKNVANDINLEKAFFKPEILTKLTSMAYCSNKSNDEDCLPDNILFYRLTTPTIDIYNTMRHIGFPLYVGSFDFYCFMVSLMCYDKFYNIVYDDSFLYKFWTMMWLKQDLELLEKSLREIHLANDFEHNPVNLIKGLWLRCDILDFTWGLLRTQ